MPLNAEILDRLIEMPRMLRALAAELAGRERLRPSPAAFSLLEHACHLRDLEKEGYALRIRRILREATPALGDFDGAIVAAERVYLAQDLASALQDFEVACRTNMEILRQLPDVMLKRTGQLVGYGEITLRQLCSLMLEHDTSHIAELRQLLTSEGAGA
jgi:hypothetical protein